MKYFILSLTFLLAASCMKSRKEYEEAITEVRQEQEAEARNEIQREEEAPAENPQRARGSNDAEGMGMDE